MYSLWDQLSICEPIWVDDNDAQSFVDYRDKDLLVEFLMALTPVFEPVQASLLHRDPLPTLEQVVTELLSEETHLGILKPTIDTVLVVPHTQTPSGSFTQICQYCPN